MKKFLVSFAVATMALISCNGANKMYGKYSFMMGKEKETHFGVEMTLSDKDYVSEPKIEGAKQLELWLKLSKDIEPQQPDPEDPNYLEALFAWMLADYLCYNGLHGYYVLKDAIYDEGQRMAVGYDFFDIPLIDSEFLENFIVSYYNRKSKSVKLVLPTSLEDLKMQLWWYGYFIDVSVQVVGDDPHIALYDFESNEGVIFVIDGEVDPEKFELGEKIDLPKPTRGERIGTHPIVDEDKGINQVEKMNEICAPLFDKLKEWGVAKLTFRDYHSLTVDLQKQE